MVLHRILWRGRVTSTFLQMPSNFASGLSLGTNVRVLLSHAMLMTCSIIDVIYHRSGQRDRNCTHVMTNIRI